MLILQFFAEAGFPCPSRRNPSDHFLRCINSDFDLVTATLMGSHRVCASMLWQFSFCCHHFWKGKITECVS